MTEPENDARETSAPQSGEISGDQIADTGDEYEYDLLNKRHGDVDNKENR